MAKKKQTSHYSREISVVHCDDCGNAHDLLVGQWIINGEGRLLCHGAGKSCATQRYQREATPRG